MMTDRDLIADFNRNAMQYFTDTNLQREELYRAYEYRDCHQWDSQKLYDRRRLDKAITTVNLAGRYVRAVAGSEIMQGKRIEVLPMDEQFNAEIDIMGDGVEFCQYASGFWSARAAAVEDAATCGFGAYLSFLDMTQKDFIAGKPSTERKFPGFVGFDTSARGSQVNEKARWKFCADPVYSAHLDEYIEYKLDGKQPKPEQMGVGDYKAFLMSFMQQQNTSQMDFLYQYFWYEYEDIYDVANPFIEQSMVPGQSIGQLLLQDEDVANIIGEVAEEIKIDWQASFWSLDKESYKSLQKAIETVALLTQTQMPALEYSKRKGKCYYRAEMAKGILLSRSRSYTQDRHPLNLITAYYDETAGVFYGLMRPLSYVQDALNETMSDFLGYTKAAASGGGIYIKGAGDALEKLIKTKAIENAVTPVPANMEIEQKALPNTPQAQVEFIRLMMEIMPQVIGVTPEFLGVISTGDMTDSLYGKIMKQNYAAMAHLGMSCEQSDMAQGYIYMDMVRLMADANDGMVLPLLSPGKKPEQYVRLRKQNLAMNYTIRLVDRPMTSDEKQTAFNNMSMMVEKLQPEQQAAVMPSLVKLSNLDQDLKDEMVQALTPKPPQPDPLNTALLESQVAWQNAQAKKQDAEAQETLAALPDTIAKLQSEVEKNLADADRMRAESKSDSAPLLKVREQNLNHAIKMRELDLKAEHNKASLDASSKPAATIQFNAEDALGKVAERLGDAAETLETMAEHTMQTNDRTAEAMLTMAAAVAEFAKAQSAPKVVEMNGKKAIIRQGA